MIPLRGWKAVALSAAASMILAACGGVGADSERSSDTYDMVGVVPLSGPLASAGEANRTAAQAAVNVINENGGINGMDVTISFENDKGEAPEAASIAQSLANSSNPPELLAPAGLTTTSVAATLSATVSKGIMGIGGPISPTLTDYPYYIGGAPGSFDGMAATLTQVRDSGAETFGLVVSDDEVGQAVEQLYEDNASDFGLEMVDSGRIPLDAVDAVSVLDSIKSEAPDALVASLYGPGAVVVLKSRAKLGWDVPLWGDQVYAANDLYQGTEPSDFDGVTIVPPASLVVGSPLDDTDAVKTMRAALEEAQGGPLPMPPGTYVPIYMSLMLVKYAADAAGSTDAEAIYDARTELDLEDMPLYAGSSLLWENYSDHWPEFAPEDFVAITPGGIENGFLVAGQ